MLFSLIFTTTLFAAVTPQFSCKATFSTLTEDRKSVYKEEPMPLSFADNTYLRYETDTDLEGKAFSMLFDKTTGDALLLLTSAPNYIKGIASQGSPDSMGRLTLAEVNGPTTHKIICELIK